MEKLKLIVKGTHCNACSKVIEGALEESNRIESAKVNFETGKTVVIYDKAKISEEEIKKIIEEAGDYEISDESCDEGCEINSQNSDNTIPFYENPTYFGYLLIFSIASLILNIILLMK